MLLRFILLLCTVSLFACGAQENPAVEVICQLESCEGGADSAEVSVAAPTSVSIAAPTNQSEALNGSIISAEFDEASQVFTLTALGLDTQLARFPSADFGNMLAMRNVDGVHNAYFAQGDGTKLVVYSGGFAGSVRQLASFGRLGGTELPLTGAAQFNGDYAGFTSTRRINGHAQIDVDFAAAKIGGRITNRTFRQRPDNAADLVNPLSTLVLEQTDLNTNGTFGGETGGGQIVNGQVLWNPASGSFTGLIGGTSAGEVVGTVDVTHRTPTGGGFEEVGGFLATR